jgi:hypothetical protein
MITKMKSFITKIRLFKAQIINKRFLEENEKILKSTFNSENNEKLNIKKITAFNKKKNYKLIRTLENILLISLFSKVDIKITFHVQFLIRIND